MKPDADKAVDNARFILPTRMLVATSLEDQDRLLPYVVAQAKATGALVTLVHAIEPKECTNTGLDGVQCTDCGEDRRDSEAKLAAMAREIEAQNVSCNWVLKRGYVIDVLQDQVALTGATRLIIVSHGRGKMGQLIFGSVANQLLGTVPVPIFMVGPHSTATPNHCTPRRILHPVSMDGDYKRGAKIAIGLAEMYDAEVTMLHIADSDIERSMQAGFAISWAEKLFAELVPEGNRIHSQIKVSIAFGEKVEQIRKQAIQMHADWIVMGVEEGFPIWPLPESTAYRTMAVASCPVLAIQLHSTVFQPLVEKELAVMT